MTDTHALGSIEPVAWQSADTWAVISARQLANTPELAGNPSLLYPTPLYALPADYLERVRAMEAENDRLAAENETLLEALCDGQLVLDPNAETQWWKHYKHLTERAALSNREDGDA